MAATREATVLRLDDGRELAFRELGDPTGTPVFAFHGTPGSHRMFGPMAADASRLGIRLIAPDRPGYGASDYLPDRRLLDWPRDVAAIASSPMPKAIDAMAMTPARTSRDRGSRGP